MKKQVEFSYDFLTDGIKEVAEKQGQTFSEFVEDTLAKAVATAQGFKLISIYTNGSQHVETDFYTLEDAQSSAYAFQRICDSQKADVEGKVMQSWKLYQFDKLLDSGSKEKRGNVCEMYEGFIYALDEKGQKCKKIY